MSPFTPKTWENTPATTTSLSAAALIDLELRLSNYTDSVAAAGIELGYAEITANFTTASTTAVDVTGLTTTVTVAARPIKVIFDCNSIRNPTASGAIVLEIYDSTAAAKVAELGYTINNANQQVPAHREIRLAPAAGTRTYKMRTSGRWR